MKRKKKTVAQELSPAELYAIQLRGYKEAASVGGVHSDWPLTTLKEDEDYKRNFRDLIDRSRDLWKTNPYFRKYRKEICDEVFGYAGISLRMAVMETEDRVVYSSDNDERAFLLSKQRENDEVCDLLEADGKNAAHLRKQIIQKRGEAKIKAGQLDLYACNLIENAWKEWQRREYCTMSGRHTYCESRQFRLIQAGRDGDCFIRLISDPAVNKFGFSIQIIDGDLCDHGLNIPAKDGMNEIRMGVEINEWGKAVAYYFCNSSQQVFYGSARSHRELAQHYLRIPANEIIHYGIFEDASSTRPVPWCTAIIGNVRNLDRYEAAAVVAARIGACQTVFLESTIIPDGGAIEPPDPSKIQQTYNLAPGTAQGLPYGVTAKQINPNYPHENFSDFRKAALRTICAGLPGASYAVMASDFESVNFSAGRLDRLSVTESWKSLQQFDIDVAERPIFEAWLKMALATGAIRLPLAKYDKFNKPVFQGRRWAGVDPMKEARANAENVKNLFTSRTKIHDEQGTDFEATVFELAREKLLLEKLGLYDEVSVENEAQQKTTEAPKGGK